MKSAFDLLMRNVRTPIKSNALNSHRSEYTGDVIIITDNKNQTISTINQKPANEDDLKNNNFDLEYATCHIKQYDNKTLNELLEEKTYLKTNLNLKSNDVYSINNLNNLHIKLGTFTNINKNFDENQSVNAFEYENVSSINDDFLNKYFNSSTYWIDLFNRMNKRNAKNEDEKQSNKVDVEVTSQETTLNNAIVVDTPSQAVTTNDCMQLRRSKRRKTDNNDQCVSINEIKSIETQKPVLEQPKVIYSTNILWTEKYQFTDENDIIYNKPQLERLKQWLEQFKKTKKSSENGNELRKKQKKSPNASNDGDELESDENEDNYDDSDFSYDSDCSTGSASSSCSSSSSSSISKRHKFYNNAILLNGAYGSGKTSAVYCVAQQLGFKVFECNTSNLRCKSQIIQDLIGVLSSHHVAANKKLSLKLLNEQAKMNNPNRNALKEHKKMIKTTKKALNMTENKIKGTLDTFFAKQQLTTTAVTTNEESKSRKRRKSLSNQNNTQQTEISVNNSLNTSFQQTNNLTILKESLILFDDIDVVLKEDQGFWSVINFFIKKSKKPIILTSNDEFILKKLDLNIEEIKFSKPTIDLCRNYLKTVLLLESKQLLNDNYYLNQLLTLNKCDLRNSLLQLQLLTTSKAKISIECSPSSSTTDVSSSNALNNHLSFNYAIIDYFNKHLKQLEVYKHFTTLNPLRYDCFVYKEGLIDDDYVAPTVLPNTLASGSISSHHHHYLTSSFNCNDTHSLVNSNRIHFLNEIISLLSMNHDCNYYSNLNIYEPNSNKVLYKFAYTHFKFTSNKSLYTDYAPYLRLICKNEQSKQEANSRRRYLHYLNTTSNSGLTKEDYAVLARETQFEIKKCVEEQQHQQSLIAPFNDTTNVTINGNNEILHEAKVNNQFTTFSDLYETN